MGAQTLWGCQHTILPNFPKNCMKLKEFGAGGVSPAPPRSANGVLTCSDKCRSQSDDHRRIERFYRSRSRRDILPPDLLKTEHSSMNTSQICFRRLVGVWEICAVNLKCIALEVISTRSEIIVSWILVEDLWTSEFSCKFC